MFKFIRNIGCLSIIVLTIFFVVALLFGGEKIRQIGDKTTGVVKKVFHYAAQKADSIHKSTLKKIDEMAKPFKSDEKRDIDNKKP
ncbi:MAG: hypothetical protein QMD43_07535 [Thermodesulfovibrio sp.]|uniref:hypothetical protein n=1 Tax=unclassified Thermodesulfovibrio TaxID=2645936 RepID=UPI00083A4BB4|nr:MULTISPECIES: hypothetical protein [unclassified Thermodesulfovibrio]MDI1472904.1 hypothetical protein [Thermodesulfovibrio sp. 1176]MDI6714856.1 hypothetical protein [Thermodesulfovibrio sp.]ODA44758.1 hypothetical protein THER_0507 [Thermodesulfovibrio sp. N1]